MATIKFQDLPNTNLLASLPLSSLNLIYTSLLQETVQKNDHSNKTGIGTRGPITRFHSKSPPPLGIQDYLNRLTKFTPFPRDSLILSSIYLNRISHLSISTAYSYSSSGSLDTFRDDPIPPNDPNRKPTTLFPNFIPNKPEPVVLFSPLVLQPTTNSVGSGVGKSSRSFSNSSLPNFDLSSPSPPSPTTAISPSLPPEPLPSTTPSSSSSSSSSSKLNRPAPLLNVFTLHRLILSTLLISTKFLVDGTLSQSRVSKVGGVSTTELGRLEIESLRLLGWSLFVETEEMEKVFKGWVQRGKELGLIPLNETEEELVNRDSEKEKEEKESLPKSPPLLIVKASAASEFSNSNQDRSLDIPNMIPTHETISSSSSSSSSSLSTSPSSTTTETTSTTISSSSNACSSPTAPDPTTIPDVLDEGGGGGSPKNETTPKGGISREPSGCKVEASDSNSNVDEAEGEVVGEGEGVGEGENTPTKAMKRIDLTTMNEQQEEEEEERISKEVEIIA
ncbi:hypothetical protein JCM5350_006816 [Sporobolomyces pararoseus]